MENYFNYFTEIEEHFQKRRGSILLLNTLDWALIETWKDAGVPLEAALRGIDEAFDRWDQRPAKTRKVNSLAYCAQEVLAAAEEMKTSAAGGGTIIENPVKPQTGLELRRVAEFLRRNGDALEKAMVPREIKPLALRMAGDLRSIADSLDVPQKMEDIERRMTVMEEKLVASLMTNTPDTDLVAIRAEADRELAPYRRNMPAAQIDHLLRQFIQKRLLERAAVPRLSLFYM